MKIEICVTELFITAQKLGKKSKHIRVIFKETSDPFTYLTIKCLSVCNIGKYLCTVI